MSNDKEKASEREIIQLRFQMHHHTIATAIALCVFFFSFLCYALSRHFLHSRFFNHARHMTKHKHSRAHKETHRLLKNNNRLRLSKNTAHLYHIRILVLYACYRLLYKPCVNQTAVAYTYAHHLYTCTWPRVIARIHTHIQDSLLNCSLRASGATQRVISYTK